MITGKNAELYFGESVYKQMNIEVVGTGIVIDNSMREQDTFTLTETLCDSSELKFGSCLPNQISFVGREIPASIKGKRLHPVEILEGNEDDPFEYGTYTVYSDVPTSDRTKRQITAYDAMYDIINADVKSWYAGLTFPMTLKAFRDSFFAHLGIAQKETTLVNDGMTVNKTLIATQTDSESTVTEESAISGKTIIEAICEINGVFGNINRDGKFDYVEIKPTINPLYPANDLYPADDLFPRDPNTVSMSGHYITFDYEDFQSRAITQLEIRTSDSNAGVMVGTSGNNYVISGNFLVSDKSGAELEAIAENTLSVIRQASYTPIKSSSCVGNPCLELGDPIRFNTSREIVESYVLQRTLTGIQSKRDSITSLGTETHSAKVNSIKDTISNVEKRTNKLERTSDHTLSEISNLDERTSTKFEQTASQIQAEITRATGEESTLRSTITQTAEEISSEISNRKSADNEMSSKIEQTASNIIQTVSGAFDKYDNGEYTISVSGIGEPSEEIAPEYSGKYYLDQNNGNLYVSNGTKWTLIKKLSTVKSNLETQISQTAHSIVLTATGGEKSVGIKIQTYDKNGDLLSETEKTANISITGLVSFADLEGEGTTKINGKNITTGNISADLISGGLLKGVRAAITDGTNAMRVMYNNDYYMMFRAGGISIHNKYPGNVVQWFASDNSMSIGLLSDTNIWDGDGNIDTGSLNENNATTHSRAEIFFKKGSSSSGSEDYIQFRCQNRPHWYRKELGNTVYFDKGEIALKSDIPTDYATKNDIKNFITGIDVSLTDKSGTSGYTSNYFLHVSGAGKTASVNAAQIHVSDRRLKEFITEAQDISRFYMLLNPVHFKYKDDVEGVDGHWHYGFIAQDVKQAFVDAGIESYNEALVGHDVDNDVWLLDKDEFHAMHVQMIQKQHKEIELLKQENLALQNRLSILEQKMEVLENVINNKNN